MKFSGSRFCVMTLGVFLILSGINVGWATTASETTTATVTQTSTSTSTDQTASGSSGKATSSTTTDEINMVKEMIKELKNQNKPAANSGTEVIVQQQQQPMGFFPFPPFPLFPMFPPSQSIIIIRDRTAPDPASTELFDKILSILEKILDKLEKKDSATDTTASGTPAITATQTGSIDATGSPTTVIGSSTGDVGSDTESTDTTASGSTGTEGTDTGADANSTLNE